MARKQERKAGANLVDENSYKGFDPVLKEFTLTEATDGSVVALTTARGSYTIPRHPTINAYIGVAITTKIRITIKKGTAWLTYWY
jgi:hypothetical protein